MFRYQLMQSVLPPLPCWEIHHLIVSSTEDIPKTDPPFVYLVMRCHAFKDDRMDMRHISLLFSCWGCPQVVAAMMMGPEGVEMSVHVRAALQIAGYILHPNRMVGRAVEIAAVAMPTPVTNYTGESWELHASHHLLLWLLSWCKGLFTSIP